jgi:hypothetical protein
MMVDAGGMNGERERRAILAEIAALGPALPGCIIERRTRCQTSGCRCRAEPPELHGPYLTWTHRENGRQVTRTVDPEFAERLRPLIENDRRLRQLVVELEQLTVTEIAAERSPPVPPTPKRTKKA